MTLGKSDISRLRLVFAGDDGVRLCHLPATMDGSKVFCLRPNGWRTIMDMESTELKTAKGPQEEEVKQFSVFMENKVGRLLDIVKMLAQARIHVVALSILDTSDAAIVRLVADDPDKARTLFQEHGLAFTEVSLVVVELSSSAADLKAVLTALLQAECNIHSAYSLLTRPRGKAALALHVEDGECACSVLQANQFKLLTQRDISR